MSGVRIPDEAPEKGRPLGGLFLVAPLRGALISRRADARLPRLRSVAGVTPLFFRFRRRFNFGGTLREGRCHPEIDRV